MCALSAAKTSAEVVSVVTLIYCQKYRQIKCRSIGNFTVLQVLFIRSSKFILCFGRPHMYVRYKTLGGMCKVLPHRATSDSLTHSTS